MLGTGKSITISPVVLNLSADGWDNICCLENHSLQLATGATAPIIGCGFVTFKLGLIKRRVEVWVAEVCDPFLIGFDFPTASECKIDLGLGILQV